MTGLRILALTATVCVTLVAGLRPMPVKALPPDPQRDFDAETCAVATARYHEVLADSPLISQSENASVLVQAEAQMMRLCEQKAPEKSQISPEGMPTEAAPKRRVPCQS